MHRIHPIDGDKHRDHLLSLAVVCLSRQTNTPIEYDDLNPDPFEATPQSDMAAIVQAFQASG